MWQRVDGDVSTTQAINAKLRALGAKTLPRLTKDVTHVIFQRKLQSTAQERNAEDGDLRTIYSKVGKVSSLGPGGRLPTADSLFPTAV